MGGPEGARRTGPQPARRGDGRPRPAGPPRRGVPAGDPRPPAPSRSSRGTPPRGVPREDGARPRRGSPPRPGRTGRTGPQRTAPAGPRRHDGERPPKERPSKGGAGRPRRDAPARPSGAAPARPARGGAGLPRLLGRLRRGPVGRGAAARPLPGGAPESADRAAARRPPRRPGRGRSGRGSAPLFFGAAAALAVVVIVAVAGLIVVSGDDGRSAQGDPARGMGRPADSGSSPQSYSSSPSTDAYRGIEERAKDARPLTEAEVFPASGRTLTVKEAGARLTLVGSRMDADCAQAVWGAAVAEELRRGGCTQAVRGMYADTRKGYALSVTIFNLTTSADSDRFVAALGRIHGGGFVRPLTDVPGGVTASPFPEELSRFGQGFGAARGLAMGHYAVIAWAQRLDGTGDPTDEALLALLIEGGKASAVLGRAAAAL